MNPEVEAWDEYRLKRKRRYIEEGLTEDAADEKATDDIRREIRNGPPIKCH